MAERRTTTRPECWSCYWGIELSGPRTDFFHGEIAYCGNCDHDVEVFISEDGDVGTTTAPEAERG